MSNVTYIPAQAAVTQVITPAKPACVLVEMTIEEACHVRGLIGGARRLANGDLRSLYVQLSELGNIPGAFYTVYPNKDA